MVIQSIALDAAVGGTRPANSRSGAAGKPRSRRKRKGGWPTSNSLPWQDVKDISALAHRAGYNVLLHIMPVNGNDAERKRFIAQTVAHLGQALQRRGQEHLGTTVYEKQPGVDLHAHHLCRVEKGNERVLANYDGYVVHVELIPRSKLAERIAYVTKQRRPLPPEFEKVVGHQRQRGMPIRGPRFSHTRAAKQILLDLDHEHAMKLERAMITGRRAGSIIQSQAMPAPVVDVAVIKPMPPTLQTAMVETQLELFALAPPARLRDYHGGLISSSVSQVIEFKRRQRGYTQQQLGRIAGISQSTLANAISGRFGLSEWAANRIREALAA